MANGANRFGSGSSSTGQRQRLGPPRSLESDDVGIPPSHHSHAGNSSQDTVPHLPRDHMHREPDPEGVVPRNVDSTTQPSDDIEDIGQRLDSLHFEDRIQQPSDSIGQSSDVPGVCGSVQQHDIGKHRSLFWFKTLLMSKNNDSNVITKIQLCRQIAE